MLRLLKQMLWKTKRINEMHDHYHDNFNNDNNNSPSIEMGRVVFLV